MKLTEVQFDKFENLKPLDFDNGAFYFGCTSIKMSIINECL